MDNRLQEMLDHYEITKLLGEYCHGLDRMDQVRMANTYAKDSWDDHGQFSCSGQEFSQRVTQLMKGGASTADSHLLGQTLIHIDGDKAGADTYFLSVCRRLEQDGSEVLLQLGGRYVDKLVREDGFWKVERRTCVRDWSVTVPVANDWMKGMDFAAGKRTNEDPSYAALGIKHSGLPGEA
jgi:SnoaL-like domain